MGRYLFVVPPLAGHVNPAAGVASELRRRGHQVAWVAHDEVVGDLLGEDRRVYPAGNCFLGHIVEHLGERERVKGPAAVKFLWDRVLVPLALDMTDPVRHAVDDFAPDAVVSDQQAFAGGMVAAERDLAWAVSATTTADLVEPLALLPKVGEWMRRQIEGLCQEVGLSELAASGFDPRRSRQLMLVYSTPALAGDVAEAGTGGPSGDGLPLAFVGPVLPERPEPAPFPWDWLDRHETNVFVSLGTVSYDIGERFLRTVLDAVAGQPYGTVMVGPADRLPHLPDSVLVRAHVPQLDLLPHMDAVVCHAGHNTTVEALAVGAPMVCAPIRDDQPVTAAQVVRAGAGVRVNFGRARSADVVRAIDTVLHDPSYRAAADRIAASFRDAGGAPVAADHLERLLPQGR